MAILHQIIFWLGLRLRPRWGAYRAPPDSLSGFEAPTSKTRGGERRRGEVPSNFLKHLYAHAHLPSIFGQTFSMQPACRRTAYNLTISLIQTITLLTKTKTKPKPNHTDNTNPVTLPY